MKSWSGIVLLLAFLTLVAAPSFCSGGVLPHCCVPGGPHHDSDHHEDSCQSDPCNRDTLHLVTKRADDDGTGFLASTLASLPVGLIAPEKRVVSAFSQRPVSPPPSATALPLIC